MEDNKNLTFEELWAVLSKDGGFSKSQECNNLIKSICQEFYIKGYRQATSDYLAEASKQFNKDKRIYEGIN